MSASSTPDSFPRLSECDKLCRSIGLSSWWRERMTETHKLLKWHEIALRHLRADRYRDALAPLCRLLLALDPAHEAVPIVRMTLALARQRLAHPPWAAAVEL
jgi:hypothetical protein